MSPPIDRGASVAEGLIGLIVALGKAIGMQQKCIEGLLELTKDAVKADPVDEATFELIASRCDYYAERSRRLAQDSGELVASVKTIWEKDK